ncbi:MAG: VWA domain-containing protein [Acidobacteriota bacterium]
MTARRAPLGRGGVLFAATTLLLATSSLTPPVHAAEVTVLEPSSLLPLFGTVEVVAGIHLEDGESVERVDLFIDGRRRGRLTEPPWRFTVDVGQENRPHKLGLKLVTADGTEARTEIETPAIRVDDEIAVELQQLYVTATRRDGGRVLDLTADDFTIFDNGKKQKLSTFAGGDVAITATLLLDASESMRGERLDAARRGASAFLDGLEDRDEAKLVLFSDRVLESTPFSGDVDALRRVLEGAEASGETVINDHLYMALQLVDGRQGRRVVVLFTDGADLDSVLDMEDVAWRAERSQALIYWLRLDDGGSAYRSFSTAWRDADGNRRQLERLEKVVSRSGGRIQVIQETADIEAAFTDIVRELREQYVLGYEPSRSRNDGSWRPVSVRTERPGVRLRARDGYVDE